MANEIKLQAVLSVTRTGMAFQGAGSMLVDQDAGCNAISNVQTIPDSTTTGTAIGMGGVTFPNDCGYLFLKNTDDTNYVELSVVNTNEAAFEAAVFAMLLPGELCLLPLKTSQTYYARANTADVIIQVAVAAA